MTLKQTYLSALPLDSCYGLNTSVHCLSSSLVLLCHPLLRGQAGSQPEGQKLPMRGLRAHKALKAHTSPRCGGGLKAHKTEVALCHAGRMDPKDR